MNLLVPTIALMTTAWLSPASASAADGQTAAALYKLTATIALGDGERWDYATYDAAADRVYVAHGDHITVVDAAKNQVVGQIGSFPGGTHGIGISTATGLGFTDDGKAGVEQHDIIAIDTHTNAVVAHFPMPDCVRPHGIAIDAQTHRVFATCVNKLMVIVDTDSGRNIASVPIGSGSDGAAFDPVRKRAISSNGEGSLTIVGEKDADHFVVLGEVPTVPSARTVAIDPVKGRLFLPAADIAKNEPPATPGGRPRITYAPGSLKLLVYTPEP